MSKCRFCGNELRVSMVDLGATPLANSYLKAEDLRKMEPCYPLHAFVCSECLLVQLDDVESPEAIFNDYLYFSSYSTSWLSHCNAYADRMIGELSLGADSLVVELASNDGYLLQFFKQKGLPVLGIEPAQNVAKIAQEKGVNTISAFFNADLANDLARQGNKADLICANNVLAHVPDINSFVEGMKILLKAKGTITIEAPHVLNLIRLRQFDTIYHEHYSYLSLVFVERLMAAHGLQVFDVDQLTTHGGSLRYHIQHQGDLRPETKALLDVRMAERESGLHDTKIYSEFGPRVVDLKCDILQFFVEARRSGQTIVGYGAPAKASTLLNYCGIGPELLPFTCDISPHKQGHYMPGSRIEIRSPDVLREVRPKYIAVFPWNLAEEISQQLSGIREWGGQLVVLVPEVKVLQ